MHFAKNYNCARKKSQAEYDQKSKCRFSYFQGKWTLSADNILNLIA